MQRPSDANVLRANHPQNQAGKGMHLPNVLTTGVLLASAAVAVKRPYSVELSGPHPRSEGQVRRLRAVADGNLTKAIPGHPHILTVYDLVNNAVEQWRDKECLGSRRLAKSHEEEKNITQVINGIEQQISKKWVYSELSPYEYRTYRDLGAESKAVGAGLRKLGLDPGENVGVYADTSAEWQIFAQGCVSQSMPIVTAYAALGKDGLRHSLSQTTARALFTNASLLPKLAGILISVPYLHNIVYHGNVDEELLRSFTRTRQIKNIISYEHLVELGHSNPIEPTPPRPIDVACIMYTSGSTGPPKGVVLTHENLIAAVAGVNNAIASSHLGRLKVDSNDRFLCFLPLAHILELVYELCAIHLGGTLGYGNPRTLTQDSVRNCQGDIQEFKPTILVAVPSVWEKVRKKINTTLSSKNAVLRGIFWTCFNLKSRLMDWGMSSTIFDPAFKKIRSATGGNVKLTISGGSPLAKDTQKFLSVTHAPLLVGYGLTESSAIATLSTPETLEYGAVGAPTSSVEIKLVDVPEMGYLHSNKHPQGEIWLRGPTVVRGYYANGDETAKAFTEDGWFKTGDVGEWQPSGNLKIIDRIKNLVKILNGEYIALERLESAYRTAKLVENVCVYAYPQKAKPIAIVRPDEETLREAVEKRGIANEDTDLGELVKNKNVMNLVMKDMLAAGKMAGLQGIELVSGIILVHEQWTPENGLVTAAMKLSRRNIEKFYHKEIEDVLAATE